MIALYKTGFSEPDRELVNEFIKTFISDDPIVFYNEFFALDIDIACFPCSELWSYTSGAIIPTPVGSMRGSYGFITDGGHSFRAEIPEFTLHSPDAPLH